MRGKKAIPGREIRVNHLTIHRVTLDGIDGMHGQISAPQELPPCRPVALRLGSFVSDIDEPKR